MYFTAGMEARGSLGGSVPWALAKTVFSVQSLSGLLLLRECLWLYQTSVG